MSSYTPDAYPGDRFRLPPRRPTSVTVIAVIHLIFGGFGLLTGVCGGIVQAVGPANFMFQPPPPPPGAKVPPFPTDFTPRMQRYLQSECPVYDTYLMTQIALGLVLSVMLVVAGIGLFGMRPWARRLSLAYAVGSIVLQLAALAYTLTFVMPALNTFYEQIGKEYPSFAPVLMFSRVGMWFGAGGALIGLVYPVLVLVLMRRPGVVAAFAGEVPPADPGDQASPERWGGPPPDAITR
jgi:hypothetical protein